MKSVKCEIYHNNFQNFKPYAIPRAQLVIADIPFNLGKNAFASSPEWYIGGDNKNGESKKAGQKFFNTDENFNLNEFFHFANTLIKKEPKAKSDAGCMIVFCSFQQQTPLIEIAKKYGFKKSIPLTFFKKTSAQVLKVNMRVVGACEYGLILYRDKLPKFRNGKNPDGTGIMIKNYFEYDGEVSEGIGFSYIQDGREVKKIHPTQKPIALLKHLIELHTDEGDIVIDPCCGSGTTLIAARELGRPSYGFEVDRNFYKLAKEALDKTSIQKGVFI